MSLSATATFADKAYIISKFLSQKILITLTLGSIQINQNQQLPSFLHSYQVFSKNQKVWQKEKLKKQRRTYQLYRISKLNELEPDLPLLKLLVPLVQDVNGVADVHPDITHAERKAGEKDVVPQVGLAGQAEHPGDDADEVEDGVPISDAHRSISGLLDDHRVSEDNGEPAVSGEPGVEAVALGNDIRHHGDNLQNQESSQQHQQLRLYLVPPEQNDHVVEDISDPVEDFPKKCALVVPAGCHPIKVIEYNATHENECCSLRAGGKEPSCHVVKEETQSSDGIWDVVDDFLEGFSLELSLKH